MICVNLSQRRIQLCERFTQILIIAIIFRFIVWNFVLNIIGKDDFFCAESLTKPLPLCEKSTYKNRLCEKYTQIIRFFVRG